MKNIMTKIFKFKIIAAYFLAVGVTISLAYSYSDIIFNSAENQYAQINMNNPLIDERIRFKRVTNETGYSNSETINKLTDIEPYFDDMETPLTINAPYNFPYIYMSLTNKFIKKQTEDDIKIRNNVVNILANFFDGNSRNYFNQMSASNQQTLDEKIIITIANIYKVNPYTLYKYYVMIPINHEIGHAYAKRASYRLFGKNYYTIPEFIDEFIAEYLGALTTFSIARKDRNIKNIEIFENALKDVYIMARGYQLESFTAYSGTAFIPIMLSEKNSVIFKDIDILTKTKYPKTFALNIAQDVLTRKSNTRFNDEILDIYLGYNNNSKKSELYFKNLKQLDVQVIRIINDINDLINKRGNNA